MDRIGGFTMRVNILMKHLFLLVICLVLYTSTCFAQAFAAPGDLDLTFSDDGVALDLIQPDVNYITAVAVQPDGKIVVAGNSRFNAAYSFDLAVARYNTDGTLDTSFDFDGFAILGIVPSGVVVNAMALQPDGKIVIAGYFFNGSNNDVIVVRYNSNGSLDTTFDTEGIVSTDISNGNELGYGVAIQSDGKILVGGQYSGGGAFQFLMIRYSTDGSLDTTFDSDGIVITTVLGANALGRSVAIQEDGKIILAGYIDTITGYDFAVVRLNTDGSLDTSFDEDGTSTANFFGLNDFGREVKIQPDGKIIVVGDVFNGDDTDFGVARFNTDGTIDTTFDNDGLVITQVNPNVFDFATSVAVQIDGKIVVGGYTFGNVNTDFAVVRYNANGSLDDALWNSSSGKLFGTGGKAIFDFGQSDQIEGIAIDSMGRIIAAGRSSNRFAVARLIGNLAPTAASVTVSGKVQTPDGRAIPLAVVSIADSSGQIRTAVTNSFGFFKFEEVEVGQTYIIFTRAKGSNFSTQVLAVDGEVGNILITAN